MLFLYSLILIHSTHSETLLEYLDWEKKINNYLFKDNDYRPTIPATYGRVRGNTSIIPQPLVNEPEQTIKMNAETYFIWEDPRLKWNPEKFAGIDYIMVNREQVWLPDVIPFDLSDILETMQKERQSVVIAANGTCYWYLPTIFTILCELDIANFPFDHQKCGLMYTAYYSTIDELLIVGDSNFTKMLIEMKMMGNNAWAVERMETVYKNFSDVSRMWIYAEMMFVFHIRRSHGYYVVLIIIPSFILTFLCIAGLFWAPMSFDTCMDKVDLGYGAILSMVLILQITTDNIPKTTQIPILSIYTIINLFIITAASLTVLIIGKYLASQTKNKNKIARFLKEWAHLACFTFFTITLVVNLSVLLSKNH